MLYKILLVSVALLVSDAAPVASTVPYLKDASFFPNREKQRLIYDLQERAVCKFKVETEVDAVSEIKYENVRCINEVFGNCEQLETSLTLANGTSLTIKSGCVSVYKTVSSLPAQMKDGRPKIM